MRARTLSSGGLLRVWSCVGLVVGLCVAMVGIAGCWATLALTAIPMIWGLVCVWSLLASKGVPSRQPSGTTVMYSFQHELCQTMAVQGQFPKASVHGEGDDDTGKTDADASSSESEPVFGTEAHGANMLSTPCQVRGV